MVSLLGVPSLFCVLMLQSFLKLLKSVPNKITPFVLFPQVLKFCGGLQSFNLNYPQNIIPCLFFIHGVRLPIYFYKIIPAFLQSILPFSRGKVYFLSSLDLRSCFQIIVYHLPNCKAPTTTLLTVKKDEYDFPSLISIFVIINIGY